MSFKLFIYYCALCGGWAALVGWALGRSLSGEAGVGSDIVQGLFLGIAVAMALVVTFVSTGTPLGLGATLIVAGLVLHRAGPWWRREASPALAAAGV